MDTLLKLLWPWAGALTRETAIADTTRYLVQTNQNTYRGMIVTQDERALKLRAHSGKSVKILKENITKISIDESH